MQTVICAVAESSDVCAWLSPQSPFPSAWKSTSVDSRRMLADRRPLRPELLYKTNGPQNYWIDLIVDPFIVSLSVMVFSVCAHFLIASVQDYALRSHLPHDSFSFCVLVVSSILSAFNLSVDSVLCQLSALDGVFPILLRFSYCFPCIIIILIIEWSRGNRRQMIKFTACCTIRLPIVPSRSKQRIEILPKTNSFGNKKSSPLFTRRTLLNGLSGKTNEKRLNHAGNQLSYSSRVMRRMPSDLNTNDRAELKHRVFSEFDPLLERYEFCSNSASLNHELESVSPSQLTQTEPTSKYFMMDSLSWSTKDAGNTEHPFIAV